MKKIKYYIFYCLTKWQKFKLRHTKSLSIKGLYASYYIIDKYLLKTKPDDYFQDYETSVDITYQRMLKRDLFTKFQVEPNRNDAAFFTIGNYLIVASDEMREQIYNHFGDWAYVENLKQYVKSGVLI